jgi:FkbM family methyltransferase
MNLIEYIKTPIGIESELTSFLNREEKNIIFEIGSCESEDTIKYSNLFPNSEIHIFEPNPDNFEKGKKNLIKFNINNVIPNNIAISDNDSDLDFFVSSGAPNGINNDDWDYGNKSSSLLKPKKVKEYYPWLNFNKKIKVKSNKLSTYCKNKNIEKIDFLHIDAQGAELSILTSAEDLIDKIKIIWLEVELVELYESQPLKSDIIDFLHKKNYKIIKDTATLISGDILFIKNI